MQRPTGRILAQIAAFIAGVIVLYGAVMEFYAIAWGTGTWYGGYSLKWGLAFVLFVLMSLALLGAWGWLIWRRGVEHRRQVQHPGTRMLGWILAAVIAATPIIVLQYTPWGIVLGGPYLRILFWMLCVAALTVVIRRTAWMPSDYANLVTALGAAGAMIVAAAALTEVTRYPFSLGWSEGNRLWDYSLLFGQRLYSVASGDHAYAYLDFGRQLIGGLPFLLPRVSIFGERLWLALVAIVPYAVLGLTAFYVGNSGKPWSWIIAALLGFLFLSQGPIHAPLVVCAILVAIAWRVPLWWAAGLVAIAGFFAETSRFTWMVAPAMWAVMLEIAGGDSHEGKLSAKTWRRALILGLSGLLGSALAYSGWLSWNVSGTGSSAVVSTSQALLWYRLLPNATYPDGVLLGLAKTAAPMVVLLAWIGRRYWKPLSIQVWVVGASLLAFLLVGLVVSTKIGGGGDLHNLDMFLIGLLFTGAILWKACHARWVPKLSQMPIGMQSVLLVALALPAFSPLMGLRPISFARDAQWLSVLADAARPRDLGSLPPDEVVQSSLDQLRRSVSEAQKKGPVLFMDQRQLLTFGYVNGVELVPDYEKKRMMDEALSQNDRYFRGFYEDLARQRFALIVSSPLRTPIKDSEYGFGEENNAWVDWVARPVLCYYEEQDTLNEVKVELLVPRESPGDCSGELPKALQ